jgi:hypothetical protein
MKIKLFLSAAALSGCAALNAATLSVPTAVQSQPDPASAVIEVLKAGSDQPLATTKAAPPPDGWLAVDVSGPFEVYVKNKDLNKQLDVLPGAHIRLAPKETAPVLTVFEKGDKAEITGLHGGWTQLRLEKTLVGYIQLGPIAAASLAPAVPAAPIPSAAGAPMAPVTGPAASPAPAAPAAPDDQVLLSRLFEGTLASARSLLSHHPFDWQLNDPSGKRIAYLDLSKLLLTDQIENYSGHAVVVLGSLRPIKDSSDLVIEAEGLRLK